MSPQYAVFGYPIDHSLSPLIHQAFAEASGIVMTYERFAVKPEELDVTLKAFQAGGGLGLNITAPHKVAAWHLVRHMSARAKVAGSVNTIHFQERGISYGDNTDGLGWQRDWQENLGWPLAGLRVLILGAGGATQGLLPILHQAGCEALFLWNRTAEKACALAAHYPELRVVETQDLSTVCPDAIINTVPWSEDRLLTRLWHPGQYCYDVLYHPDPTIFCSSAHKAGVKAVASGLGMLVEQAAESFYLWHGVRPATAPVRAKLAEIITNLAVTP